MGGCSGDARDVVGRAGKMTLDAGELRELIAELPEPARAAVGTDQVALERLIRGELARRALVEEATSARLDADPKVVAQLERVREEALMRLWIAKQAQVDENYPDDEDLKLAYRTNAAALAVPAQYRVAQIFVAAPNGIDPARLATAMRKAADVGSRIEGGDFAALAREYSEHAESAPRGGDVGLLPADQMLPEIVAAVRDHEVGDVVGPVKTSQGLHYVKLLEKKVAPPPSFEETRERLRLALRAQRAQELERAYLAELEARLDVAVDQIALTQLKGGPGAAAKTP